MAEITAAAVKELRTKTGAGMMDCKKALGETDGDVEKAIDWLRQKGLSSAAKKAGRAATEGTVASYVHGNGKLGVLVEVNCETDFVARNDAFQDLVKDIAMHIAAAAPTVVRREELPADQLERELDVYRGQLKEQGKPEKIWDKILEGKKEKYYSEVVLLEQPFVKDTDKTIQDLVNESISKIGENISIRRFARFVLGEGLEKKEENFAEEIAKTAGLSQ